MKMYTGLLLIFAVLPLVGANNKAEVLQAGLKKDVEFLKNTLHFPEVVRPNFVGRYKILPKSNAKPAIAVASPVSPVATAHQAVIPAQQKAASDAAIIKGAQALNVQFRYGEKIYCSDGDWVQNFYVKIPKGHRITYRRCRQGKIAEATKCVDEHLQCIGYELKGGANDPEKIYNYLKQEFHTTKACSSSTVGNLQGL